MDESVLRKLEAWLEFYRELGIENFQSRPLKSAEQGAIRTIKRPSPSVAAQGIVTEPVIPGERQAMDAVRQPRQVPTARVVPPSPFSPRGPASFPGRPPERTLNLFEPAATRRGPETLDEVRADLGDCHRCRLAEGRKTIVFGQGNPRAELVFVGEGPGADEDEQGLPFVGRAGQLLNRLIHSIGLKRDDVYIGNVVKCRPPGNRTPQQDEIETCSPFLLRQIEAIQPRLVCCLGAPAVRTLLGLKEGIMKIRGRFYDYGEAKAFATVHPAYVLRNPRDEKILREDFEKIREFLRSPR